MPLKPVHCWIYWPKP